MIKVRKYLKLDQCDFIYFSFKCEDFKKIYEYSGKEYIETTFKGITPLI
jgi:hypothetical protein